MLHKCKLDVYRPYSIGYKWTSHGISIYTGAIEYRLEFKYIVLNLLQRRIFFIKTPQSLHKIAIHIYLKCNEQISTRTRPTRNAFKSLLSEVIVTKQILKILLYIVKYTLR